MRRSRPLLLGAPNELQLRASGRLSSYELLWRLLAVKLLLTLNGVLRRCPHKYSWLTRSHCIGKNWLTSDGSSNRLTQLSPQLVLLNKLLWHSLCSHSLLDLRLSNAKRLLTWGLLVSLLDKYPLVHRN